MGNRFLKPLYKFVYGEEFEPRDFEARMKLQKEIYLLQEEGINVGDYDFLWYKHGPYSQTLQNDILNLSNTPDVELKYTDEAESILKELRTMIHKSTQYTLSQWVECLASLQYLRSNVFGRSAKEMDIINELQTRKPHLNNRRENQKAIRLLKKYIG